jgi:hypothetical protein
MSNKMIKRLRYRLKFGKCSEIEDANCEIKRSFCHMATIWGSVVSHPLTNSLPFSLSNDSEFKKNKVIYKVRIRVNSLSLVVQQEMNAILWKDKILINFYKFLPDLSENYLEGLFYADCQENEYD